MRLTCLCIITLAVNIILLSLLYVIIYVRLLSISKKLNSDPPEFFVPISRKDFLIRLKGQENDFPSTDEDLIRTLAWLAADNRDGGDSFTSEACDKAAARLRELTDPCGGWISTEWEMPPEDDTVLAVVNGKLGNIKFINSIETAQWCDDEGWLLCFNVEAGSNDHIEIKWWRPLPEAPEKINADKNDK